MIATTDAKTTPGRLLETLDPAEGSGSRFAFWLSLAVALTIVLRGLLWVTGFEARALTSAVEQGAARVEQKGVGEVGDDVVRKAIELQRSTLPFWTTLATLADFALEPFSLVMRALLTATVFSALAALTGRPIRFGRALDASALIQLYWVAGLATKVGLTIALRRTDVETSAALFLAPGRHPAVLVVLLRQADLFAFIGWLALAWSAWKRGQANLFVAVLVVFSLALGEATIRAACTLLVGGGMRLSILPDTPA